jgi:transcriptional regulator with XRE-family HTH domain
MSNRQRTPEEFAFNTTVGNNIKYLRKTRNLNQSKVAAALSVSFQSIGKYEKGVNGLCALKLKQLADFFKVGTDVLVDPNLITAHRGFTGDMDWLKPVPIKETLTQVGSDGSVIDVTFDVAKYQDFEDEYPMPLSQLEHDPKMRATYDAILEDE